MRVTVIVLNYKNQAETIHFVRDELSALSCPLSVVVFNNGATPESDDELMTALGLERAEAGLRESQEGRYLMSDPENLGFAKACNRAACFASEVLKADYLLFSNPDIRFPDADVLEYLVSKLESEEGAGMVGPRVEGLDGLAQSPEPYYPFWDRYFLQYAMTPFMSAARKAERFSLNYPEKAEEGFHYKLMGSFFMMKTQVFMEAGMMDPHTFLYSEEVILTERLARIGKKPYYAPGRRVIHAHGTTIKKNFSSVQSSVMQLESESYYYHEYKGVPKWQLGLGTWLYKLIKRTLLDH